MGDPLRRPNSSHSPSPTLADASDTARSFGNRRDKAAAVSTIAAEPQRQPWKPASLITMSIQYAGGTNVNAVFTGNMKNDILSNVYTQLVTAGWSVVTGNVPSTVTMTIATPGVVSWTAHGLTAGTQVRFQTTGALPTGVTANTTYYVIATGLTANSFQFSASFGGAAVNTSGTQSVPIQTLNSVTDLTPNPA